MKSDISSLELHFLLKELQPLISAKVEQIYQIAKDELIIQLHVPSKGKHILRIILGKLMYLASNKGDVPEKPPGFCLHLRKRLKNSRLRSLKQLGFERIIEFLFETKDQKFKLIIELFSKGNIVLCNEDNKIISVMERQEWKDRSIKPGEVYAYPKKEHDFLELTKEELAKILNTSQKENLVKALAIELGLGGVYAEELCLISKTDKNLKPNQLSDKEVDSIFNAATTLQSAPVEPSIIFKTEEKKDIKDIVPIKIRFYESLPFESAESFNKALDTILTTKSEEKAIESTESAARTKIDKVEEMIRQQEQRITGLEKSEQDNQRKGEIIYENYPLVEQALARIKELRQEMSWKEIKEKFKGHKIIKDINEKTGEITLEI
jgi:predicted ribosome quality control (RQC) complex YloA/Tae2 family protein